MPNISSNKIHTLVIGGAGYIGMHLIPLLLATGRQVTVLGRRSQPINALPQGATYIQGDFAQKALLDALLPTHQEVIHLAYATVPNTSFENPLTDLLQNLPPMVQLFSEVAARKNKLLLVSSGGTVYGEAHKLPISEDHPTKAISPYGVTKLTLEHYAYLYAITNGLQYVCVRPANAFGEGQRPFTGQGFISTAMASVMRKQPIKVFGQDGVVRDYIHVSDIATGILAALEQGQLSESYNIGTGRGSSTMDIVTAMRPIMQAAGHEILLEYLPARAFDVKANVLDTTKLQTHTGWQAVVGLEEGLSRTYKWLKEVADV